MYLCGWNLHFYQIQSHKHDKKSIVLPFPLKKKRSIRYNIELIWQLYYIINDTFRQLIGIICNKNNFTFDSLQYFPIAIFGIQQKKVICAIQTNDFHYKRQINQKVDTKMDAKNMVFYQKINF